MEKRQKVTVTACTQIVGPAALGLLMFASTLAAQEVYRWVDENGVVNFSDTSPAGRIEGVSTVDLGEPTPPGSDPEEDLYNIAATAERTQALRDAMAADREARRERQRESLTQQAPPYPQTSSYALPPWWWDRPGYGRPPQRPPTRPEPPEPEPYPTATLKPPGQGG